MSLNPIGTVSYNWNYSNQGKDGFSLELWGTVVSLQEVQARDYNPQSGQPGRPKFWSDGKPVMNIRVGFATPDGSLKSITFQRAGKAQREGTKPSLHMQLFEISGGDMNNLKGKTLHMWTWPANPNTGATWGQGNPRLFGVELVDDVVYELSIPLPSEYSVERLLADDAVSGGQLQGAPQMQGQYYAPPTTQSAYQPQPQYQQQAYQPQPQQRHRDYWDGYYGQPQQPAYQPQPQYQQQAYQPQQYAQTAPMPSGMDPVVAQAMQAVGATSVHPYDDGMPF